MRSRNVRLIGAISALLSLSTTEAFSIHSHNSCAAMQTSVLLYAKKQSMAERRKSRARRLQKANPLVNRPPPKIRPDQRDTVSETSEDVQTAKALEETDTKAKQLLRSQRESVEMLRFVRERLDLLDTTLLSSALDDKGYHFIDNFLESDDVVSKIEKEGQSLFENELMQVDLDTIGLGEYTYSIKGGQEQYQSCPRSIEFVVSTTKHFPGDLDKTKTMASMRTFSRSSWLASVKLLTGNDQVVDEPAPRSFRTVLNGDDDARKLSMVYFAVPAGWTCGGGLTFRDDSRETVEARRDRLVIWKSDLAYRQDTWRGSDEMPLASCIELHLVQ